MAKHKGLPEANLAWRRKQKRGAIMKPQTFQKIKADAMKRGMSEERATKVAGASYWKSEKKKYSERKKND